MTTERRTRPTQQGFVMLAVIWVLLAMLVGVALFSHWVYGSLQQAQQRQDTLNARIAAHSALNAALYIRLTGQRSPYGVAVPESAGTEQDLLALFQFDDMGALIIDQQKAAQADTFAFDHQVWRYGNLHFVAQDTAGLIGLTEFDHRLVVRHLLRNSRTHLRPQQLIDSYLDYRDADNYRRLNGAEAFDYRLQGRSEPLNGALRNPLQLRDVMHWDQVLRPWSNGELLYRLRVEGGTTVNINSASEEVLRWVLDDNQLAQRFYAQRRSQPYTSIFELEAQIASQAVSIGIEPADGLRFWWWEKTSPSAWVHEFHYDALLPGPAALKQDWVLRVDVPEGFSRQQSQEIGWGLLPAFPDYLGRTRSP